MAKTCNNCSIEPKQFTEKSVIFSNVAYEAHEYLHERREKRLLIVAFVFAMLFLLSNIFWVGMVTKKAADSETVQSETKPGIQPINYECTLSTVVDELPQNKKKRSTARNH